jgi:N-formylglutamate amidohydrolase
VNREPYELDPRMFTGRLPSFANTRSMRVAGGLGTIPRVVGDGQEIYRERLSVDDALGGSRRSTSRITGRCGG